MSFPGLETDKYHALAEKYMPNGTCGVISFGVPGGREKVSAFLDHLKMVSIATHVADARSCTLYPAGTTHRQLTEEQLVEAGVGIDLVRLSCGIENADDIIADLDQALAAVQDNTAPAQRPARGTQPSRTRCSCPAQTPLRLFVAEIPPSK